MSTAMATTNGTNGHASALAAPPKLALETATREQLEALKSQTCVGLTDSEFSFFIEVCKMRRLNPFTRQIYAIKRHGKDGAKITHQTGIDGFRCLAQRNPGYRGQTAPQWCGPDMVWRDVWLDRTPPAAARLGIWMDGFREPVWGVARFESYRQDTPLWSKMADNQLAKCAEALALRKACAEDLSGLYIDDEMGQADAPVPVHIEQAPPPAAPKPAKPAKDRTPEERASAALERVAKARNPQELSRVKVAWSKAQGLPEEIRLAVNAAIEARARAFAEVPIAGDVFHAQFD